ncbi:MAG: cytochrome C biogenesis protein [Bacteroidetes bacterium B1(2017)]|nr:MAG: cytochrome C biogenesis protein [Bacteroidetes bacterium B1(2017)]
MSSVTFIGEHLFWGNLGHSAVVVSFITSILACLSYFFAQNNPLDKSWATLAKYSFHLHSLAVLTIIGSLFKIIYSHYFEYHYAWQHSSTDLPVHFMISCFWEGQEGSFLLWIFWQMVIGQILLRTAKDWLNPVMAVVMLSQVALTSMLLGVKIFSYKLGSSPFELLRNVMANAPIFQLPDYLSKVKDGNGLNPLLQNYWMVIHPPTLFFGFATTVVPFAYAIASLWRKDYSNWLKPALPWALISAMVLGAGIIMGGFWAYESLSFGGYWAWDPVENASLVPWLILIAGVHVLIIHKSTGNSYIVGLILIITTFLMVLYATFLTRSGILGNSSVHSFTDLGMSGQLLVFLLIFVVLSIVLIVMRWKEMPRSAKDEEIYTREFWMFIGSLVLVISSFQVTLTTSIPVFNKLFSANLAPPADVIAHYNKWQMPMAIIIGILTAVAQMLKYKKNTSVAIKKIGIYAGIALVMSAGLYFVFELQNPIYIGLLFAGVYGVVANFALLVPFLKGKITLAGASVAHIGFGFLLIGVLVSSANKQVISINQSGQAINPDFDNKENVENIYLERGKPAKMGDYIITYVKDSQQWVNTYYQVNYKKLNKLDSVEYEFNLYPNGQINPKFGLVANPDTKHYWGHDVFTYVSSVPSEKAGAKFINEKTHTVGIGDTLYTNNGIAILQGINSNTDASKIDTKNFQVLLGAELKVYTLDKVYDAVPLYGVQNNTATSYEALVDEAKLKFRFAGVDPDTRKITIISSEKDTSGDFIIMKAIVFPMINFVWAGTIIMIVGFFLSILKRMRELKA